MKKALELFAKRFSPPGRKPGGCVSIASLTNSADAFLALSIAIREETAVLAVTSGLPDADRLFSDIATLIEHLYPKQSQKAPSLLEFPRADDEERNAFAIRMKTAAALNEARKKKSPLIVVADATALSDPIPEDFPETIRVSLNKDEFRLSFSELTERLAKSGYSRVSQVRQEGESSVRGGIVDAWSPGEEFPVRIEFFGDDLESIRTFSPATQSSVSQITSAAFTPLTAGQTDESKNTSLIEILPPHSTVIALEHNAYSLPEISERNKNTAYFIFTGDPAPQGCATDPLITSPLPGFSALSADAARHPELFEQARLRLARHIESSEKRGAHILNIDNLSGGFELPGEGKTKSLIVVSKADRSFVKRSVRFRRDKMISLSGERISDFDELEPGEYVVHIDYGVGRYIGSSEINIDGQRSEVFTVEYAEGGKLHIPSTHAHLLSRYVGVKGEKINLHRLDGKRWEKDKRDAQKAVADLAASLLETQARRETVPGFSFDIQCDGIDAFEEAFPYEETKDQSSAINDIKSDMAARKPMDRLICGDAGYGKTEIAMRAAYIAAMNGKQTVVLAPTTILAEQHFETFTSRFDGTSVRIECLSRLQTPKTREGTFKRISSGVCDIVIGTHAVLSSKIFFHDLGLIIIDEEQRFGVKHKEFLKTLKATADVLTLSATPIPRTLYMSMTGARDLSLLRTPPRERVAVVTKIERDSDHTVSSAISAEIARGGQVFFLHNRIATIHLVEKRLKTLCPSCRITVAHGRMDAKELAAKMKAFENGEFDILLSTTIVESGLDIPRANTIIVARADTFGLADLYQIRGRVGRSSRQGYAYMLLPASGTVDSDARERLSSLRRHAGLGAGFNLAVRDLELRGAGNLLGSQQSGHVAAVGFTLYCQLLKRTIAMMKGEKVAETIDVKLNLDFSRPSIPAEYIEDDALRLASIRRFSEAQNLKNVSALVSEMRDRFGPLPNKVKEFAAVASLRILCSQARITSIDSRGSRAVFYRSHSREIAFVETLKGNTAEEKIAELTRRVQAEIQSFSKA